MNSKQRKQFKKKFTAQGLRLADYFDAVANDETKQEVLTKADLKEMAKTMREIINAHPNSI